MPRAKGLTVLGIDALPARARRYADRDGLYVRVSVSGSGAQKKVTKSWVLKFVSPVTGSVRYTGLGSYPKLSLADARIEAERLRKKVRKEEICYARTTLSLSSGVPMPQWTVAVLLILGMAMPAAAEQFTVRCERDSYYFLTFDTATNRMASETMHGRNYIGEIKSISETEIAFTQFVTKEKVLRYERQEGNFLDAEGNPTDMKNCVRVDTHEILNQWDSFHQFQR